MADDTLRALALAAAKQARAANLSQSSIAEALGASQSQVSRVLSGRSVRRSRLFNEVCKYVETAARGVSPATVHKNPELMDALAAVWDGTPSHAAALAAVIRSLGALSTAQQPLRPAVMRRK